MYEIDFQSEDYHDMESIISNRSCDCDLYFQFYLLFFYNQSSKNIISLHFLLKHVLLTIKSIIDFNPSITMFDDLELLKYDINEVFNCQTFTCGMTFQIYFNLLTFLLNTNKYYLYIFDLNISVYYKSILYDKLFGYITPSLILYFQDSITEKLTSMVTENALRKRTEFKDIHNEIISKNFDKTIYKTINF